ncbi:HD-GYP domain-containing protein [Brevibacillus sp. SYSU BS000544]|uniref:HD-GYP domain-containing protein n=1 Tax=Brevibacillus sp. SYSU BS000544 TaxID=3416443 RepID=UPI003CE4A911
MRLLTIGQVRTGMKLAKTLYTPDGKVLLGAGMVLNDRLIQGLLKSRVDSIFIEDDRTSDIIVRDVIKPQTRQAAIETIQKTVKQITNTNKIARRVSVKDMGMHFQQVFHAILGDIMGNEEILSHLSSISQHSGGMYHHSVNVAVLSTAIGMSLGYNRQQLTELGIGALLHDIGKIDLPKELLDKNTRWTQEEIEISKQHSMNGFNILRKQHDLSLLSAHVALQHHERLDGSGYPQGLKKNQIHEYAQIVGICDVYDSLTTPRPWRRRFMPQDALEYLLGSGGHLFSHHLIDAFRRHIAIFPLGSGVVLNTGETGVICKIDPDYCHRPTVRILKDGRGNDIRLPYEIDLKEELRMHIIGFEDEELFSVKQAASQ